MSASPEEADDVADRIARRVHDGMHTHEILSLVFRCLRRHKPATIHRFDLREAIGSMRSKPDFEQFIRLVLQELGYRVTPSRVLRGRCVEHEVDAVAEKKDERVYVEVKHHVNHHTFTGLDTCLEVRATFEDLVEGFRKGVQPVKFTKAMLACNTKFSDHAVRYARCRGILCLGWKTPQRAGLERIVEEAQLYPVTLLRNLSRRAAARLGDIGVVLLKQLEEGDVEELHNRSGVRKEILQRYKERAHLLLAR